ncbi:MAG: hypothetical protein HHJ15_06340 [Rhodoferax sp.]|uniref:hypothetical protein n=1 Tax=Rhodoferax sp. TaxID=50421 RepID=UPI0017B24B8F|nr:hypothetical protein [Rhodoferax sp.]NMM19557.1 hypothetical protein [Rhodoferax sp.]
MELFDDLPPPPDAAPTQIAPSAVLLHGFARDGEAALLQAIESVLNQAALADGEHALLGRRRLNLTFRCAG